MEHFFNTFADVPVIAKPLAALVAFSFQFVPWLAGLFAFQLAGGVLGKGKELITGKSKQIGQMVKGNPNDPNSIGNRAKRGALAGITAAQHQVIQEGRDVENSTPWQQARSAIARRIPGGDSIDERKSRMNKEAAELRERLSNTGSDALIYAGGGWKEKGADGVTRYYNSKGKQILKDEYNHGKSRYGYDASSLGQTLGYTLYKASSDEDLRNFHKSFENAARENNWSQEQAADVWAAATYGHKGMFASEWYSKPEVVKDANGRTVGVRHKDVSINQDSFREMNKDLHRTRQSFTINGDRDRDFRNMYAWQQKLESRVMTSANGDDSYYERQAEQQAAQAKAEGRQVKDAHGNVLIGNGVKEHFKENLKQQDRDDLVRVYETFDAVTQRLQAPGGLTQDTSGQPVGGVSAAGSTPASQPWVETAVNRRAMSLSKDIANDGSRALVISSNMNPEQGTGVTRMAGRGRGGDALPGYGVPEEDAARYNPYANAA